ETFSRWRRWDNEHRRGCEETAKRCCGDDGEPGCSERQRVGECEAKRERKAQAQRAVRTDAAVLHDLADVARVAATTHSVAEVRDGILVERAGQSRFDDEGEQHRDESGPELVGEPQRARGRYTDERADERKPAHCATQSD